MNMAKQADDHKFEELFKKRLGNHEEAPPPMAWEKIAPKIGKNGFSYKRYILLLLLLLIPAGTYVWSEFGLSDTPPKKETDLEKNTLQHQSVIPNTLDEQSHLNALKDEKNKELHPLNQNDVAQNDVNTSKKDQQISSDDWNQLNLYDQNAGKDQTKSIYQDQKLTHTANDHRQIIENQKDKRELKIDAIDKSLHSKALGMKLKIAKNDSSTSKEAQEEIELFRKHICLLPDLQKEMLILANAKQPKARSEKHQEIIYFIAPNYSFERVETNRNDDLFVTSNDEINQFNTSNIGLSAGIGYRSSFGHSKRFAAFGNLEYSLLRKRTRFNVTTPIPTGQFTFFDSVGTLNIQPTFEPTAVDEIALYHLLGLRIGIDWALARSNLNKRIVLTAGLDGLLAHQLPTVDFLNLEHKSFVHPVGTLGYELSYPLSDRLRLKVMPYVSYYFSSLFTESSSITSRPYTIGFRLSLGFQRKPVSDHEK